jgi:hypothetical protein
MKFKSSLIILGLVHLYVPAWLIPALSALHSPSSLGYPELIECIQ